MAEAIVYRSRAQTDAMVANSMRKVLGFSRKKRTNFSQNMLDAGAVYIFNVSDKVFKWHQAGFDYYTISACSPDREYSEPCKIPGLVEEEYLKVDSTELNTYEAPEIAMAIIGVGPGIRPENDLRQYGVFISRTNPPSKEEVEEAQNRLLGTCTALFREGNRIDREGQSRGQNGVGGQMISGDMFWAAKVLGQNPNWSKSTQVMHECPACGGAVPAGAIVHFGANGCGAMVDMSAEGWERAVQAGLKTRSQMEEALKKPEKGRKGQEQ